MQELKDYISAFFTVSKSDLIKIAHFTFQTAGRWNIVALTDCELYTIDHKTYINSTNIIPKWAEIDKLFVTRCLVAIEDNMFSQLYMTAEERFKKLFAENPELFNQVPLQYLASMLGMTPETLSRLRSKTIREFS